MYLEILILILFIVSVFSFFSLAPFLPTKKSDLKRINKLINLKQWERFLEIWCWNSRVSLFIAKNNLESKVVWIEFSPFFYLISKIRVFLCPFKNIKIIYWNALNLDFKNYDVLYVFWLPETVTQKIFPKLKKEMKDNARFFSYCFRMTNDYFKEERIKEKETINTVYKYTKK